MALPGLAPCSTHLIHFFVAVLLASFGVPALARQPPPWVSLPWREAAVEVVQARTRRWQELVSALSGDFMARGLEFEMIRRQSRGFTYESLAYAILPSELLPAAVAHARVSITLQLSRANGRIRAPPVSRLSVERFLMAEADFVDVAGEDSVQRWRCAIPSLDAGAQAWERVKAGLRDQQQRHEQDAAGHARAGRRNHIRRRQRNSGL